MTSIPGIFWDISGSPRDYPKLIAGKKHLSKVWGGHGPLAPPLATPLLGDGMLRPSPNHGTVRLPIIRYFAGSDRAVNIMRRSLSPQTSSHASPHLRCKMPSRRHSVYYHPLIHGAPHVQRLPDLCKARRVVKRSLFSVFLNNW